MCSGFPPVRESRLWVFFLMVANRDFTFSQSGFNHGLQIISAFVPHPNPCGYLLKVKVIIRINDNIKYLFTIWHKIPWLKKRLRVRFYL